MRALEQFAEAHLDKMENESFHERDSNIDNPLLNFQNSDIYLEKQKATLKEKVRQSTLAIEHFYSIGKELKAKKLEVQQKIVSECLRALALPSEIKLCKQNVWNQRF